MTERAKNKASAKKDQSFKRRILKDEEIKAFAAHMRKFMGPAFAALSDQYGLSMEDMLRFQPLACRLADARTAKGLTLKEVASSLKVPKYRLAYIESASIGNIGPEIVVRYIEFLGLARWFSRWKKANTEFAGRLGFPVRREKK